MNHVVVLHRLGGAVKVVRFEAPVVGATMVDGGIHVTMRTEADGRDIGYAMFTRAGPVALAGPAIDQYGPLSKPAPMEGTDG